MRPGGDIRSGLSRRMLIASGLLGLLICCTFGFLYAAIAGLRDAADRTSRSEEALTSANRLERLLVDVETGERGYLITKDRAFLEPWNAARTAIPGQVAGLERAAGRIDANQRRQAVEIGRGIQAYIDGYAVPLVSAAQRDPRAGERLVTSGVGKRQTDALRVRFDRFARDERAITARQRARSDVAARRVTMMAMAGTGLSLALVGLYAGYLSRAIVRPVRRASALAGAIAGGDLGVRMPETSPAEIGGFERTVNTMVGSLSAQRDRTYRLAEEHAALKRVATLVARGAAPEPITTAVAAELGRLMRVDYVLINRYESDDTSTVVGHWTGPAAPKIMPPLDGHWPLEDETVGEEVRRTGASARMVYPENPRSKIGSWARSQGIHYVVGVPIMVQGRTWGVATLLSLATTPQPPDTEVRALGFMELIGTAIANTESRAELAASRTRVLAAADETRRRIERELRSGTEQRLVSIGFELREVEADIPNGQEELREQIAAAAQGVTELLGELEEISQGLHPASLTKGGLKPALETLANRSAIPVELTANTGRRLHETVEVTIYYVVSEALTNAIKHANASRVRVVLDVEDNFVRLTVEDDGSGGAIVGKGSGLTGLHDRVESLGGRFEVDSPPGRGTALSITLPATIT